MPGEMFGPGATRGPKAQNVDELLRHAGEKIGAAEARLRERASGRRRRAWLSSAGERKAQVAREASLSVRDIYRKLASALHPDRESDPVQRQRKTVLIQRANRAYEANDLLELLSLQIETEQSHAGALGNLPEARLEHYNHVLLEQAQALDAELSTSS